MANKSLRDYAISSMKMKVWTAQCALCWLPYSSSTELVEKTRKSMTCHGYLLHIDVLSKFAAEYRSFELSPYYAKNKSK
jgi:hypothetical protein